MHEIMATILHRIKAFLYNNPLTDDPNDYVARVSSERSTMQFGGTTLLKESRTVAFDKILTVQ
jgi:hypothetical protein